MTDNTRKDRQSRARERVKRAGGHRITVAISAEALAALGKICDRRGMSQGQAVSYALESGNFPSFDEVFDARIDAMLFCASIADACCIDTQTMKRVENRTASFIAAELRKRVDNLKLARAEVVAMEAAQ